MPFVSIVFGLLLIALGVEGYTNTFDLFHVKALHSPTSLIPAGFGLALLFCGVVGLKPSARKHAMHAAAMFGLIGFIGALVMSARKLAPLFRGELDNPAAVKLQLVMAVLCGGFVALCVNSFIQARRRRKAAKS